MRGVVRQHAHAALAEMPISRTGFGRQRWAGLWYQAIWRLAPSRVLHRIRTTVWLAADDPEKCFSRVDEALDLIERYDPITLQSIQRLFRGICVFGDERFRAASWIPAANLCVITSRYLESDAAAQRVALTLAHEHMHARLWALGVPYHDGRRARIEVLCAMAELALARRLPHSPGLVEHVERRIEDWSTGGEDRWSDQTMRAARLAQLREMGTPEWLMRVIERLIPRRAA